METNKQAEAHLAKARGWVRSPRGEAPFHPERAATCSGGARETASVTRVVPLSLLESSSVKVKRTDRRAGLDRACCSVT